MTDIEHIHQSTALSSVGAAPRLDGLSRMADVIEDLWVAHALLTGAKTLDERASAIDEAERLLRKLPPSGSRDDGLDVVEAARYGDGQARRQLADSLKHVRWALEGARDKKLAAAKPRSKRKPPIRKMIAAAELDGRTVTSVTTTADGVTLHFGKAEAVPVEDTEASNPWLADLDKAARQ